MYCNTLVCIAIHWFVLQRRGLKLYCKRVKCIAIEAAWLLKKLYYNTVWWAAGLYCNTNCIVSLGKAWVEIQHGQALGARNWALRHGAGRCDTARRAAGAGGSWGAQALGRAGRARQADAGQARSSGARQAGARQAGGTGTRQAGAWGAGELGRGRGRGRREAAGMGARGAGLVGRPGRSGWPRAVHSVHSACFWPGLTRYFS